MRELFGFIGRYKPQSVELETKIKPFIPDYIPAVGGIDEFIKVPRPDGKPDYLGLKVGPGQWGPGLGLRAVAPWPLCELRRAENAWPPPV